MADTVDMQKEKKNYERSNVLSLQVQGNVPGHRITTNLS
jgi:hypothetical protein